MTVGPYIVSDIQGASFSIAPEDDDDDDINFFINIASLLGLTEDSNPEPSPSSIPSIQCFEDFDVQQAFRRVKRPSSLGDDIVLNVILYTNLTTNLELLFISGSSQLPVEQLQKISALASQLSILKVDF
ncbi:hypothetical protein JCGZ_18415 [Jatropha curcas]|uniref:Uncharacterized protein n=1 Tax=Jatropha curcas TaxID=180498 RepID=A0A067KC76_JATCU|nr:hypothetical protein JCGZ_18415 [Jatropha curcas]